MEINNLNSILAQYYNSLLAQNVNSQSGGLQNTSLNQRATAISYEQLVGTHNGNDIVEQPMRYPAGTPLPEIINKYIQEHPNESPLAPADTALVQPVATTLTNNEPLVAYLASKQANLNAIIPSFQGYQYTSNPEAALIAGSELINPKDYVLGAIIIDPQVNDIAGQLFKAHAANFSVNEWRAVVEQAILANGGLGNSEDGFLAWSKDGHFVRLRNTNLTPEQNQKLASMSLEFGWAVEDLPSSKSESIIGDDQKIADLDSRIANYEEKINAFRQDPNQDFTLKYGKHRYTVSYDPQTGMFTSRSYKLRSGFKGWFDKCAKKISTGLGICKNVFKFIPGWGTIVSKCCEVAKKITDAYRAKNPLHTR